MAVNLTSSGLVMPATVSLSSDANTLDDYEEGSWAVASQGHAGNRVYECTGSCWYTKVGKFVNAGQLNDSQSTASGTGTSDTRYWALPFAVSTAMNNTRWAGVIQYSVTAPVNYYSLVWRTYDGLGAWQLCMYQAGLDNSISVAMLADATYMDAHGSTCYPTDV